MHAGPLLSCLQFGDLISTTAALPVVKDFDTVFDISVVCTNDHAVFTLQTDFDVEIIRFEYTCTNSNGTQISGDLREPMGGIAFPPQSGTTGMLPPNTICTLSGCYHNLIKDYKLPNRSCTIMTDPQDTILPSPSSSVMVTPSSSLSIVHPPSSSSSVVHPPSSSSSVMVTPSSSPSITPADSKTDSMGQIPTTVVAVVISAVGALTILIVPMIVCILYLRHQSKNRYNDLYKNYDTEKIDPDFCPTDNAKMVPAESMHSFFCGLDWDYIKASNPTAFEIKDDKDEDDEVSTLLESTQTCDTGSCRSVLMATENSTNETTFTAETTTATPISTINRLQAQSKNVQRLQNTIEGVAQSGYVQEGSPGNANTAVISDGLESTFHGEAQPSSSQPLSQKNTASGYVQETGDRQPSMAVPNQPHSHNITSVCTAGLVAQSGYVQEGTNAATTSLELDGNASAFEDGEQQNELQVNAHPMRGYTSQLLVRKSARSGYVEDPSNDQPSVMIPDLSHSENTPANAVPVPAVSTVGGYVTEQSEVMHTFTQHQEAAIDQFDFNSMEEFEPVSTTSRMQSGAPSNSGYMTETHGDVSHLSYVANFDHHTQDQQSQCDTISSMDFLFIDNPEHSNTNSSQLDPGYSTYPEVSVTESHPNSIQGHLIQSQQQSDAPTVSCSVTDTGISAHQSSYTQSNATVNYVSQEGITGTYTTAAASGSVSVEDTFCCDDDDEPLGTIQNTQTSGYIGRDVSSTDTSHSLEGPAYSSKAQADSSYIGHSAGVSSTSSIQANHAVQKQIADTPPQEYHTEHTQPPSAAEVLNRGGAFASTVKGSYVTASATQNSSLPVVNDTVMSPQLPGCVGFSIQNEEIQQMTTSSSGYVVKKSGFRAYETSIGVQSTTEAPAFTLSSQNYLISTASDMSCQCISDVCMTESRAGFFSPLSTPEYTDSPFLQRDELGSRLASDELGSRLASDELGSRLASGYVSSTETANLYADLEEYPVHSNAMKHSESQSPSIDDPFASTENLYQTSVNGNPAQLKTGLDKHIKQAKQVIPSLLFKSKLTGSPPLVKRFVSRTLSFDSDYCSGYSSSSPSTPMTPASDLPKLKKAAVTTPPHDHTHSASSLSQTCTATEFDGTSGCTNSSASTPSSQTHATFNGSSSAVIPSLLCKRESTSSLPSIKEIPSHITVHGIDHTTAGDEFSTANTPTTPDSEVQGRSNRVVIPSLLHKDIDSPTSPSTQDSPLNMIRSSYSSSGYMGSISSNESTISSDDIFSMSTSDASDYTSGYISSTASNHSRNSGDHANTNAGITAPSIVLGNVPETIASQEVGTAAPSQVGYTTGSEGITTTVLPRPQKLYHIDSFQYYTASPVATVIPSLIGRYSSNK